MYGKGKFVISLDVELNWGVFDVFEKDSYQENLLGAREVIPILLERFKQNQIHATWGVVGFLFFSNKQELIKYSPTNQPQYKNRKLCPYDHLKRVGKNEEEDPYHYGASLIRMLKEYQKYNQEIGTHTYSHYYSLAEGQDRAAFEADVVHALAVAKRNGIPMKTIIFPRNQVNPDYFSVCKKHHLGIYRGNENHWLYNSTTEQEGFIKRAIRLMDSYMNISGTHIYELSRLVEQDNIVNIPSSSFLRPYSPKLKWLETLKLNRIKRGMTKAAKEGMVYHLWWHPHNFGAHIDENLRMLDAILEHYQRLKNQYGMESCNMGELGEFVLKKYTPNYCLEECGVLHEYTN